MRTAFSRTTLLEPRTLGEALRWLRDEPAVPLAGCTDVYVGFNFGTQPARRFLNIWNLDRAARHHVGRSSAPPGCAHDMDRDRTISGGPEAAADAL